MMLMRRALLRAQPLQPRQRQPIRVATAASVEPWLVRSLRSGRSRRPPRSNTTTATTASASASPAAVKDPSVQRAELQRQQAHMRTKALARELPAVPSYIRVRDLAKVLRKPVDEVLKRAQVIRRDRRLHMTLGRDRFKFKNVKQVVLPFQRAEQVAAAFGAEISYDDVEPTFRDAPTLARSAEAVPLTTPGRRTPVIAVMGHVDHGKTTLMDSLRSCTSTSTARLAPPSITAREVQGITQKINICEAQLTPGLRATFLDTPGHFHFFRMRTNAAQVADLALLIVAGDEGCCQQTEESIGAIEDSQLPVIVCINKMDITSREKLAAVRNDIRSYLALQSCPIIDISARDGTNLPALQTLIADTLETSPVIQQRLLLNKGDDDDGGADAVKGDGKKNKTTGLIRNAAQGIVLESVVQKGRGTVLRVLLRHGELQEKDHFVAGMIHGVVRSVRNADSDALLERGLPGTVVDVMFANKSKTVDAPIEAGLFVLPESRARQVIEQRQLALDFAECVVPSDNRASGEQEDDSDLAVLREEEDNGEVEEDGIHDDDGNADDGAPSFIVVKADGAGSLTSIQDTVDELAGIVTVRIGIGNITAHDIDVAIDQDCPIFGFNVKLRQREAKMAAARGVRVVLHDTIHGLIEDVESLQKPDPSSES